MRRTGDSFITVSAQWVGNIMEGFAAPPIKIPQCPTDYTFFNDSKGDSFCCAGAVNPYTHVCTATEPNELCAFTDEAEDPRGGRIPLPRCADLREPSVPAAEVTAPFPTPTATATATATATPTAPKISERPKPEPNDSPSVLFGEKIPSYDAQFTLVTVETNKTQGCSTWKALPNLNLDTA